MVDHLFLILQISTREKKLWWNSSYTCGVARVVWNRICGCDNQFRDRILEQKTAAINSGIEGRVSHVYKEYFLPRSYPIAFEPSLGSTRTTSVAASLEICISIGLTVTGQRCAMPRAHTYYTWSKLYITAPLCIANIRTKRRITFIIGDISMYGNLKHGSLRGLYMDIYVYCIWMASRCTGNWEIHIKFFRVDYYMMDCYWI